MRGACEHTFCRTACGSSVASCRISSHAACALLRPDLLASMLPLSRSACGWSDAVVLPACGCISCSSAPSSVPAAGGSPPSRSTGAGATRLEPTIAGAVGTGDTRPSSSVTSIAMQRTELPAKRARVVRDEKHRKLDIGK